ncbi:MAG: hypothetical protein HHJ11_14915 [Phycicoccus sp.]|nr:hypothetical protein [Phycicoccus sp.]NMM34777.1 hypothetical protein [Phycicoccus sp.]
MIVLGLLLILAAVGATVFAVTAPSAAAQTIEVSALGFTISASPLAMFIAGALSVILIGLGFALINRGARRKASSRKELRELRKGQADAAASPAAEAGQHSSRHRLQKDGATGSDTDTKNETGTHTSSESGTESSD